MVERMQMYKCDKCESMAAVVRGGCGQLSCCGQDMSLHQDAVIESHMAGQTPPMEYNLTLSAKSVIELIQTRVGKETTYFGVAAQKNPLDAWVYQEMIFDLKPDVVIEIGNAYGGGTLALAHILDLIGKGIVVGLDIQHETMAPVTRAHPRVTLITGNACESIDEVKGIIREGDTVLVIEDSEHTYENTLNVLRTFAPLVTVGSYIIVEDSHCHHGFDYGPTPGAYEAVQQYLSENDSFESDRTKESFFITFNPTGYLRRTK